MKKKNNSISNLGDEEHEDIEGEENRMCPHSIVIPYEEADRCPICLSCMLEKEVGFPENCNHIFCITCILKWAETLPSCPIDRKPFQAVCKFSALEGCVKVQVEKQLRETDDKKNECSFKKQDSCSVYIKSCMRKRTDVKRDQNAKFYKDLKKMHRNTSNSEITKRKATSIKINKPQRQNCPNHCFRNYFSSVFSSDNHTGESTCTFRSYCTGLTEVTEINSVIRQKRQELQLSWFPDTLPGIASFFRIGFIPWMAGTEILPLVSSMLPGTILPMNTISLEDFGSSCEQHVLAHTQGGEEKKQTSGTSNSRGTRRKPTETTPRRRSTRNMKTETVNQPQNSPISNNSECDAPGSNNSSLNVSTSADSKKQIRPVPKRKPKRRTRKAPIVKKKLRSSSSLPEKSSSSDSADEEVVESDTLPLLDKEYISNTESCNSCIIMQTEIEQESANGLGSFIEYANSEEFEKHGGRELDTVEKSYSDSCNQDPSVLNEEEIKEIESKGTEADIMYLENELSKRVTEKIDEPIETPVKTPEHLEFELKASAPLESPQNELFTHSKSEDDVHQVSASLRDELFESTESKVNEEQYRENLKVNILGHIDSETKILCIESSEAESLECEEALPGEDHTPESPKIELLDHTESVELDCSGNEECTTVCSNKENFRSVQESKNLLEENLPSDSDKLDKSLEEKSEFLTEENRSTELSNLDTEQFPKHFNEDNNETIPMECDSFCSEQNESESELTVSVETKLEENSQDKIKDSDLVSEKSAKLTHETENSAFSVDKAKKPRTRRSRFHSPSTTWSPSRDIVRERKRSQSRSPKKDTGKESRKSHSQSPKMEITRGRRRSRSQSRSPKRDVARERKRSQSWSPKREEGRKSQSLSPRRDTSRESRRSQSRTKDSPSREKSRSRSRERENNRDGQRRDRLRERRARRWSRSRSRSRSCSRSRTKSNKASFSRNDRDSYSPRWKERWTNDNWRFPRGNDRYRKNEQDKQNENLKKEKNEVNPGMDEQGSADKHRNDCPDWIMERINSGPDPRTRNTEKFKDSHWEENRHDDAGKSWNKNFGSNWMSNRGRGNRGRGTFRAGFGHVEQNENRWQNRKPLSGNSNSSGNESSKFIEQQPYRRKSEQEFSFDTPADRSGWTSASSWAVRKTLPADVQNYYSRRGRSSSGPQSGWMRQEEETPDQDQNLKDQTNQQGDGTQLPITMMPQQMNVMQQQMNAQHQTMNIFPYPVGVHAPLMNIQRNPFNIHPQLPMHLHTGVPLMQVAAPTNVSQGLPPPPPPPPPSQQVNYIASQTDGKQSQGIPSASHVGNNTSTSGLPTPTATPGNMGPFQGPSSGNASSSSHSKAPNAAVKLAESKVSVTVEASADSSKTDKKLQIQEKAAQEVKLAIKPFYQNKDITKEEYKEIVRKAVDKVCHSKSGEVNSAKVANLVKAYVDKYKHSRKGSQKKNPEEPASTEKKIG
ncbi:protein SCAF11 isoform X1 [Vombatus ursinus]|uniref:SR-related CTD associated factor 11 n=1 Tax=Vombatus ursinus TaxID=29139 RepID=A0A4X2KHM4_VOMUR|nr:protein SCAF11 isoform X1 [Vombatus ursinus]